MFSLFGQRRKPRRGTGIWPFPNPRPWNLTPAYGEDVIIDPVVVAQAAAEGLQQAGWPGLGLMDFDFQMSLIDKPTADIELAVSGWYTNNVAAVCEELSRRLATYSIDGFSRTVRIAMTEAIRSYSAGHFLSVVRTLLPEFEVLARGLYSGAGKPTQKAVISALKAILDSVTIAGTDAIESMSLYHFIDDKLFAQCFSTADAQALGEVPNRHAELHGLESYGNQKGATTLLVVTSFLMELVDRHRAESAVNGP